MSINEFGLTAAQLAEIEALAARAPSGAKGKAAPLGRSTGPQRRYKMGGGALSPRQRAIYSVGRDGRPNHDGAVAAGLDVTAEVKAAVLGAPPGTAIDVTGWRDSAELVGPIQGRLKALIAAGYLVRVERGNSPLYERTNKPA